jgi:nitrogen regulatory protein PII
MHAVKKLEIVASSFELAKLLEALDRAGSNSHAVLRNVATKGLQGYSEEDLEMTMLDNVYILAFCAPERLKDALEGIRPILNKYGGTCFVSDVMEVRSIRCVASL